MLYADDEKVYFCHYKSEGTVSIYKFVLSTRTCTYVKLGYLSYKIGTGEALTSAGFAMAWQYSGTQSGIFNGLNIFKRVQGYASLSGDVYKFDVDTETLSYMGTTGNDYRFTNNSKNIGFSPVYNSIVQLIESSSGSITTRSKGYTRKTDRIHGCNFYGDKYFAKGNVYRVNSDLSVGELIKEDVYTEADAFDSSYDNTKLFHCITDNIYGYRGAGYGNVNSNIMQFNEDTNTFEILTTGEFYFTDGKLWQYNSSTQTFTMYNFEHGSQIGINYQGKFLRLIPEATRNAYDILQGASVYSSTNTQIVGTMVNNKQLSYTPTTSAQSIPEGYTSGGTIEAVTSSIDSNIKTNNIKKDITILGITGEYEGVMSESELNQLNSLADDILGDE